MRPAAAYAAGLLLCEAEAGAACQRRTHALPPICRGTLRGLRWRRPACAPASLQPPAVLAAAPPCRAPPCLALLPQNEVVSILQQQVKIEPGFTQLVWQKLEEQNQEFFRWGGRGGGGGGHRGTGHA